MRLFLGYFEYKNYPDVACQTALFQIAWIFVNLQQEELHPLGKRSTLG